MLSNSTNFNMEDDYSAGMHNAMINNNVVETHVRFVGNMQTISQIIQLLAYIRHAVKNNLNTNINVHIGNNIVNTELAFDVNNQEINDYITQKNININ